jgi:hypothetical protein
MALTPEHTWIYLVICRLFVGFGVTGMYSVDITIIHMWTAAACEGVEFSFGEMVRCSHMSGPLVRCL